MTDANNSQTTEHVWISAARSGYRTSTRKCTWCDTWEDDDHLRPCQGRRDQDDQDRMLDSLGV